MSDTHPVAPVFLPPTKGPAAGDPARARLRAISVALTRAEMDQRPLRGLDELREELRSVEERLLALVADDPDKVTAMNELLDQRYLNGVDFTRLRSSRLEAKIRDLSQTLALHQSQWLYAKMPQNALKTAIGKFRSALMSDSAPKPKTIERIVSDLYLACDRMIEQRVVEEVTERLATDSIPTSNTTAPEHPEESDTRP